MNSIHAARLRLWSAALVLSVLVLLPVGRSSEAPLVIGALIGLVLLVRHRLDLHGQAMQLVVVLFVCYWVPAFVSGFGAIEPGKTWPTVLVTLRFLPFALFGVWALSDSEIWHRLIEAAGVIVLLWVVDAYVQMTTGYSLGGVAEAERVSGIFGAGNLKLGPVLAVLSPFLLLAARARLGRWGLVIALLLLVAPILLAGSRAAWVAYALVCLVLLWRETLRPSRFTIALLALAVGVGVIGAFTLHESTRFDARIDRSLRVFAGTEGALDYASAGRIRIWRTAVAMSAAHPLTGVGVRGFRYAYPQYAAPGDHFIDTAGDTGASHAHQIVLEVLSETGIVGVLFWLAGVGFAIQEWRRADALARERALAPGLALVAMCFPLNTHLAFYSAWWGLLFWWLLALYCAALGAHPRADTHAT